VFFDELVYFRHSFEFIGCSFRSALLTFLYGGKGVTGRTWAFASSAEHGSAVESDTMAISESGLTCRCRIIRDARRSLFEIAGEHRDELSGAQNINEAGSLWVP
jgi:hypothetical protein